MMKISKDDGLPQQICIRCEENLNFIDQFYRDCHDFQQKLITESKIIKENTEANKESEYNCITTLNKKKKKNDAADDAEINKENTAPSTYKGKKKRTLSKFSPIMKINETCQLSDELSNQEFHVREINSTKQLTELDIKQEIEEKPLVKPVSFLSKDIMVWIHSFDLPEINNPNRPEQNVMDKISSFDEKENVESTESQRDLLNDIESPVINQENEININTSLNNNNEQNRKPKITELITKEEKQIIEKHYKIDMSIVDKKKIALNMTVLGKGNFKCNICSLPYSRRDKCEVHIWRHLNIKPYQCIICNFATVTLTNVRCHIRKSHLKLKPYFCMQCPKRYTSFVLLKEHMNSHTGAQPYKCEQCNFASNSRQSLNNHKDTHILNQNLPCPICNKSFSSRIKLRTHKRIHNNDRIMCEHCRVYLSNKIALEIHYKNMHLQDYKCNVCSKMLKSKKALYSHMNIHSEAKHKCFTCLNVYKSKHILNEHILKHKGIRNYQCSNCNKTFAQMSHLAAHMKVHNPPSYKCEGCQKKFNRHDNMKIHMKRCIACKTLANNNS